MCPHLPILDSATRVALLRSEALCLFVFLTV